MSDVLSKFIKNSERRNIYSKIIVLALPASLEMILQNLFTVLDGAFISRVGADPLAGVGFCNQIISLLIIFIGTLGVGSGILIGQNFGKQNMRAICQIIGQLIILAISISIILVISLMLIGKNIFLLVGATESVAQYSSMYWNIAVFSIPFIVVSNFLCSSIRSLGNTKLPFIINCLGLGLDTILNYVVIFIIKKDTDFSIWGIAISTVISRSVIVILLLLYLFKKEKKLDFKKYDFKFNFPILKKMIGLSSKVFVGEGIWVLGSFFYTYCCIQKGTSDLLMQQIIFGVEEIFIMASFGLTSCGMIMISHEIGKGQIKSMKEHAKLILKSGRIISIVSGFLLIIFSAFFIQYVYDNIDVEIIKNIKFVLYFNAIFMSIKVCSFILGNGILKGGGDLTSVMLYDILAMSFGIITAFILSIIFNYGFYGAFIGKVLEEILRFILMYSRYKSEKYYKSIV